MGGLAVGRSVGRPIDLIARQLPISIVATSDDDYDDDGDLTT